MTRNKENLLLSCIVSVIVIGLSFVGYLAYKQSQSPTFELYKNEFACSKEHTQVATSLIPDGKVNLIPYVTSSQVCDIYTRIIK